MWKTLGCWVGIAVLSVSAAGQAREAPSLQGQAAAWWVTQLKEQRVETKAKLEAAGAEAVPLLIWLLKHGGESAPYEAAVALTRLGPLAKPAARELLDALQNQSSWWAQFQSAHALAAIGDNRAPVRDAMLAHICTSDVPRLRHECAAALAKLVPAAPAILLRAVSEQRFVALDYAIAVLCDLGERAVPTLLANVERGDRRGRVAQEALVGIGWRVASRLEQAGHAELAQRALREGPMREVSGAELYAVKLRDAQPPAQALPTLQFSYGYGHGNTMSVWRAGEGPRGFRIERMAVVEGHLEGGSVDYALRTESLVLPRAHALDMTRQLHALARLELDLQAAKPETWVASGSFWSSIRTEVGEHELLQATFAGYPSGDNVLQRFRAEAARNVLFEAVRGLDWKVRQPVAADLQAVVAARKLGHGDQAWWIDRRLRGLQDALAKALR